MQTLTGVLWLGAGQVEASREVGVRRTEERQEFRVLLSDSHLAFDLSHSEQHCEMSRRHSATPRSRSVSSNSSRPSKTSSVNFISGNPHRVRWGSDKVVQQSEYSTQSGSGVNKIAGSEEEGEEEEIEFEGITLAITALRGRLGCAYYDSNDNTIYFLEDQLDSTEFDLANLGASCSFFPYSSRRRAHLTNRV